MNLLDRAATALGSRPGRRDFREDLLRYFAGDLDRVERRRFEVEVMSSRFRERVFSAEWDARTREQGFLALGAPDPDLSECFSTLTLGAYARGELSDPDRELIDVHLPCPVCGAQVSAMREEVRQHARTTWTERLQESLGRLMGLLWSPGTALTTTMVVVAFLVLRQPWLERSSPSPQRSEYRGISDGIATLNLYAITSDQDSIRVRDGVELPNGVRFSVKGTNQDIERARYFTVFSISSAGEVTWHLPAWDGLIPPSMTELPPDARDATWSEGGPDLPPGLHHVVLLMSFSPTNLSRLEAALKTQSTEPVDVETLMNLVGHRATISLARVRVR